MGMLEEIGEYLESQGIGTTASGNPGPTITYGQVPSSPDNVVSLFETVSSHPERVMGTTWMPDHEAVGLQIKSRALSRVTSREKIQDVFRVLENFVGTLNGTRYLCILARHTPIQLGVDENKRHTYVCNFAIRRVPS